jgi:hypothetical protein
VAAPLVNHDPGPVSGWNVRNSSYSPSREISIVPSSVPHCRHALLLRASAYMWLLDLCCRSFRLSLLLDPTLH